MLLLKKHLVDLVRAGKKTQTIRVWSRPVVRAGQVSYTPGLGKMLIVRVDELAGFDQLTDADAVADGFSDKDELLAELKRHYPEIPPGKRLFRIIFQWPLTTAENAKPARPTGVSTAKPREAVRKTKVKLTQPVSHMTPKPSSGAPSTDAPATGRDASSKRQRAQLRDFIQTRAKASGWIG